MNASDADIGRNAEITYALADLQPENSQGQGRGQGQGRPVMEDGGAGEDAGVCVEKFVVNSETGVVTAKTPLDHEQRAVYECRVLAFDAGEPPNTGQTSNSTFKLHRGFV